jgi:hypothetical protein
MKWITRERPRIDRIYDALYAWCKECQAETHHWPLAV